MIIDTHAHYDDHRYDEDRDQIISSFSENGIEAAINVGSDLYSLDKVPEIIAEYDNIYGAAGLHPDEIGGLTSDTLKKIEELVKDPKMVAVGEIGLDYHWNKENKETQKEAFIKQMEIARNAGLPIIVHSRDAAKDTMDVIKENDAASIGGIIHCYSGSVEMAREYTDMGFYIGIGGIVTFKNARVLKDVVKDTDLKHLVLETDCPYLAPDPFRGERNSSLLLPYVVKAVAELKDISEEKVIAVTNENAKKLFHI